MEFWQASGETSGAIQVWFQGCPSLRVCWFNLVQAISSCVGLSQNTGYNMSGHLIYHVFQPRWAYHGHIFAVNCPMKNS